MTHDWQYAATLGELASIGSRSRSAKTLTKDRKEAIINARLKFPREVLSAKEIASRVDLTEERVFQILREVES